MSFFNLFKSAKSEIEEYVVNNAIRFTSMCCKLNSENNVKGDIYYYKKVSSTGATQIFAEHIFYSNDVLEYAHDCVKSNNKNEVEYLYNAMIKRYNLDQSDLISFPDKSDFFDLLQGGISGYNTFTRDHSQIKITQKLGQTLPENADATLSDIINKCSQFGKNSKSSYNGFTLYIS